MKSIKLEYGEGFISVRVPGRTVTKGMRPAPEPVDARRAIPEALATPIAAPPLVEIARAKREANPDVQAVIVVSDNTRPVPYHGEGGLMVHLVRALREAGLKDEQITVVIGAGSHRDMEPDEIEKMLGLEAAGMGSVAVVNHQYENPEHVVHIGQTTGGADVLINRRYMEAGLKIVTGLVESHFMAGASGGRKGICPGIVGKETLSVFHDARPLSSKKAADLVLEGNPVHDLALEVALMAGCDFLLNVTIDAEKRVTGVFAGDLVEAHRQAVAKIREYVLVDLDQRYDVVIIPAGFVGLNHYQAAKAAIEASRAVKPGGWIIIAAKNIDLDPIGGAGYKEALRLLSDLGKNEFVNAISAPEWKLIQEQWQVQMWCKVFDLLGSPDHLIYCALEIEPAAYDVLPGTAGIQLLDEEERRSLDPERAVKRMVERALAHALEESDQEKPSVLFLKDGPYGIPELTQPVPTEA